MKVSIKRRALKNGCHSLMLDFSPALKHPKTGKYKRLEFLKLFVYDEPTNKLERKHNSETMALVESVRAQRQLDIQNRKFGFISDQERSSSFVDYFNDYVRKRKKSVSDEYQMSVRYFIDFAGHDCTFLDLDDFFCEDYRKYLLKGPALGRRKNKIQVNTAVSYFAKFRSCLKQAYRQGLLTTDLFSRVDAIKPKETHRENLEIEEFQLLANTPVKSAVVKRAAIFAGLTGLRFSDVKTLKWSEVRGVNGKFYLQFVQEKTAGAETLPVSDQAIAVLGKRGLPEDKVFKGFNYSEMRKVLADWLIAAGITKNITFHSFRHTFATLQLEFGTEIYTVSKMLGHRSIKTTQIYAKVKDKKKFEAAKRIKLDMKWLKTTKI